MLNRAIQRNLISKAHHLHPVVMIGQKGITENVHTEIEAALLAHELIKIRVIAPTRETRVEWVKELADSHKAALIQQVGHIAVFFRANPEKRK